MMYGSESWTVPSTVMERLNCTERKLLRRLLGYFWPRVCHNEDLYAEIDVVYRRMTRGRHQHLATTAIESGQSESSSLLWSYNKETSRSPCTTSSEGFVGFELEESTWPKAEVVAEVVKKDMRTVGVDRQFKRDENEDREGWPELCSKTAHLGEYEDNCVRR